MHKKLFTAVLALGLLLLTASSGFAIDQSPHAAGEPPVKGFGSVGSKTGTPVLGSLVADPLVTVNAGQNRTVPGTFCSGQYQGPLAYGISGWYAGGEFYAGYQDPQDASRFGSVCANSPSFDVTAVNTILGNTAGPFPFTIVMQPLVLAVASPSADPNCTQEPAPVAGGFECLGPAYSITWTTSGFFSINLPFALECCQTGAYYAGWYSGTPGAGTIRIGTDRGSNAGAGQHAVTGQNFCSQWNEYGAGWLDMDQFWQANFGAAFDLTNLTWSEGYTPNDPATHCTPGTCATELHYDPLAAIDAGFGLPSGVGGGRDRLGVRASANGLDTITAITFAMNGGAIADKADLWLEVWDASGPLSPCGLPRPAFPGTMLYSEVIPEAAWAPGFFNTWTLTTPFVWGTLNGGPTEHIVVVLGRVDGTGTTNGVYGSGPITGCDTDYMWSIARFQPALNEWRYIGEVSAQHRELLIELDICREQLPAVELACGPGSDDQWSSFAHDNGQTSASSLNVGDPNGVTLAWTRALPRISNFTNPTVHNDRIYMSSDQELNVYDLATGAPLGAQLSGAPQMGSSNRGNTTVAYIAALTRDVVFATGGNFNAITALETNLESSAFIWSNNVTNFNVPNGLGAQNRFNTSKVVNIAGTDVLFVSTEPAAGTAAVYAFDAATGALYPGWGTNPVITDAAAKHGPAVNGGKLYVGTAVGGSNVAGSLYQIDAATGVVDWNFVGIPGEGWPSGVSTEGDFVYGATRDAGGAGYRYKIDVSGALPSVVWTSAQGVGLYGTPTIGRNFVYFPLDNPSFGLLQVNKDLGLVSRNFAASDICGASVFMVPQIVTLSCDAFLFAGDRNARWWLFNAETGEAEWYRQFPVVNGGEIVSGTALASHSGGTDYAVVAVRQLGGTVGQLSSYALNQGTRPRLIQCVTDVTISVPLNSGAGQPHNEAGALLNVGNVPLNLLSYSVSDPLPGLASIGNGTRTLMSNMAAAAREFDGYSNIATTSNLTKHHRLNGLSSEMVDGEFPMMTAKRMEFADENLPSVRNSSRTSAASAAMIRTSAVTVNGAGFPTALAPGASGDLDWLFDGTALGRGQDANDLEIENDDPDFNYDAVNNGGISTAVVHILYVGGCLNAEDTLDFGAANHEHVFNYGGLGFQARADAFYFDTDPVDPETNLYDGGLMLLGDSLPGVPLVDGGAQIRIQIYTTSSAGHNGHFVANVAPQSIQCGFDHFEDIVLGARRTGGCPGTPVEIHGEVITHSMSDTDQTVPAGLRLAAIGMDIVQTEVGAYDPLYGDFKLIEWDVINRDAVAKGPIYIGSWCDWDVVPTFGSNTGNFSAAANGYYIYDDAAAGAKNAYGALDPSHLSTYSGIQPLNPAKRIVVHDNSARQGGAWPAQDLEAVWSETVNETPAYGVDVPITGTDKAGLLINAGMNFGPNQTISRYHAFFGVPATNEALVEANTVALAKRAARWAGFARGDVNDDGLVDLADVCWLQGGNYIYPAAYSGDVDADGDNDAADIARLLSFVSGNAGDQPAGAWRF